MKRLDKNAVWIFFTRKLLLLCGIAIIPYFVAIALLLEFTEEIIHALRQDPSLWWVAAFTLIGSVVVLLILAFVWGWLEHHFYRYELREDVFRQEFGIIAKSYTTIPYERIQNVNIVRGFVARLVSVSVLHIETAGGTVGTEGRLPGVSRKEAERLRNEIIEKARTARNDGLNS